MARKAVDVVLLASEEMADRAIESNRQLVKKFGAKIVLDKNDWIPAFAGMTLFCGFTALFHLIFKGQ